MLIPTLTLDADLTVEAALVRLDETPPETHVVVRRTEGLDVYWYRFSVRIVRMILGRRDPQETLMTALDLHESGASDVFDIDSLSGLAAETASGILLEGGRAIGVLEPAPTEVTRGDGGIAAPPMPGGPVRGPAAPDPGVAPGAVATLDTGFAAFPHLESPPFAAVGQEIAVVVRLGREPQEGTGDAAVLVETELDEFDLIVQIIADGFTIPKVREILHVDRNDLAANEARFTIVADPISAPAVATRIEVEFSFGGQVCGRAWRSIAIVPEGADGGQVGEPAGGASIVTARTDPVAPDLEVTITENDARTTLHWRFTSRWDIEIPENAVHTLFREHNAESFAQVQIRQAHKAASAAAIPNRMMGIARTIADEMPPEFWQVLGRVWEAKKDEDDPLPTVLLSSSDTFIPWELASTEEDYVDPALIDDTIPPILGAQVRISRWMTARLRGRSGKQNPPAPPPSAVTINRLALVIGDYLATSGQRDLPKAKEEGNALGALYPSVRLAATIDEIGPLFNGQLIVDGESLQPTAIHFACHGAIEPNNPLFNGIILNDGNQRLDELYVRGNRLANPFVFMNACQLGTASEQVADYGGMAAAFLKTGSTGFIAPLWSVDDQAAHDTAIDFYATAIDEGLPLAEVLRRQRAKFDMESPAPQPTFLAYVYYGHPNTRIAVS